MKEISGAHRDMSEMEVKLGESWNFYKSQLNLEFLIGFSGLVTNKLSLLSNVQYIENRVYEDETDEDSDAESQLKN